jgi:predicted ArsR family transcriptional regulator
VTAGEERAAPSGDRFAGSDPVTQALDLLEGLGFSPVVSDDPPRGSAHGATHAALLLRTCPLLDAARDRPDIVCTVHQGLMEGFLRARGTRADVVVVPFAESNGCRATIRA